MNVQLAGRGWFCSFSGNLEHPAEWSFWLWLSTVVFLSLAIFFALIVAITTMINVIYVPISDIAGVQGVYVWNFVACELKYPCNVVFPQEIQARPQKLSLELYSEVNNRGG